MADNSGWGEFANAALAYYLKQQGSKAPKQYPVQLSPEDKRLADLHYASLLPGGSPERNMLGSYVGQYLQGLPQGAPPNFSFTSPAMKGQTFAGGFAPPKFNFGSLPGQLPGGNGGAATIAAPAGGGGVGQGGGGGVKNLDVASGDPGSLGSGPGRLAENDPNTNVGIHGSIGSSDPTAGGSRMPDPYGAIGSPDRGVGLPGGTPEAIPSTTAQSAAPWTSAPDKWAAFAAAHPWVSNIIKYGTSGVATAVGGPWAAYAATAFWKWMGTGQTQPPPPTSSGAPPAGPPPAGAPGVY